MDESYLKMFEAFRNYGNYDEVFADALSKIGKDVRLGSVRSCLSIGPGKGQWEIEFLKHCGANISKFLAVERDHASAEYLRKSLTTGLPGVESQVFETDIRNWEGLSDPVDLILIFHSLYLVEASDRQELFKKVHDRWSSSGGYVAIAHASRTKSRHSAEKIFERLGSPTVTWEDVEADMQKAGFTKHHVHEMLMTKEFANPDESLLRFLRMHVKAPVTLDDVRDAAKELYGEGKADEFNILAIFKRTY